MSDKIGSTGKISFVRIKSSVETKPLTGKVISLNSKQKTYSSKTYNKIYNLTKD